MTSADTTTAKTRKPSRATRAAAQNTKPATTARSTSARSPATKSTGTRKINAEAAEARAGLLAARAADAKDVLALPAGYKIHWAYPAGHSRLSRTDGAPEGAPKWLARCDAHGTTTPASDAKSARALGSRARRLTWCKPCATAAKSRAAKSSASSKSTTTTSATTSKPARTTGDDASDSATN